MTTKYLPLRQDDSENDFTFDYASTFNYEPALQLTSPVDRSTYRSIFQFPEPLHCDQSTLTEEPPVSRCLRNIVSLVCHMAILFTFPLSGWLCLKRIPSLERLIVFRLGKMLPAKGPGLVLVLPCIDQWMKIDLRPRTFTVSPQQILLSDGAIVEAGADIQFHVADVSRSVTRVQNLDYTVQQLGKQCLVNFLSQREQNCIEELKSVAQAELQADLNRTVVSWGLEATDVKLHSVKVLKAAEPADALTPVLSAIRGALGVDSNNGSQDLWRMALMGHTQMDQNMQHIPSVSNASHLQSKTPVANQIEDPTPLQLLEHTIRDVCSSPVGKESLANAMATFGFNITGDKGGHLYCSIQNGSLQFQEANFNHYSPDVTLTMPDSVLDAILHHQLSPLQAFFEGKVQAEGDSNLLYKVSSLLGHS